MKRVLLAANYGLIGGLFLTFLFKWIEFSTGKKVYTFLLNVDYIPVVGDIAFPEWVEVFFHIVISVLVAIGFYLVYRLRPFWKKHAVIICTSGSVIIGIALFPTTALSDRTPALTDVHSLLYWLMGHALYGGVLGILFNFEK